MNEKLKRLKTLHPNQMKLILDGLGVLKLDIVKKVEGDEMISQVKDIQSLSDQLKEYMTEWSKQHQNQEEEW